MLQLLQVFLLLLLQLLSGLLQLRVERLQRPVRRRLRRVRNILDGGQRLLDGLLVNGPQRRRHLPHQGVEEAQQLRRREVDFFAQRVDVLALKHKHLRL